MIVQVQQRPQSDRVMEEEFSAFVADGRFPCLAGKGAVHRGDHTLRIYDTLGSHDSAEALARDLTMFVQSGPADGAGLRAFVALFRGPEMADELAFERRLWGQLRRLHALDDPDTAWDPTVSDDPESPEFSFSFCGRALFVVGMHPASSRLARRFRWPTLVFNPRAQFERLRAEGKFERLRTLVRERDVALQGTPNPSLADFGERSEARQYSGRATEPEWRCPFHRKNA
ncbi:MAG TPA: guanitoxin biosynthesis heme-dependent pre-guanitoxin N-hydroxylase GntA [Gemmatimonadaceae bacterium]|nr:guanitoxin biosynthesis heme-dependent pre-guanitoxin N-hydroxylase GntA [Gemmatimonadaceae bacterium]